MDTETFCSSCVNYCYDEDIGFSECIANFDEDEYERFMRDTHSVCPYYRPNDEYAVVRRQI
ncbi:hypothetical protein IJ596_03015 [bacterium]|nr:hypothetical protein [bacterium]